MTNTASIPAAESKLLSVENIEVIYDGSILAVADISLDVGRGQIVALLGANGAGKSTTLKAISGLVQADRARVSRGQIYFAGNNIVGSAPHILARAGIVQVLEGRHVFAHLTVEENLQSGAFLRRLSRRDLNADIEQIYGWFPRLKVKRKILAGLTSGGEQQMLAIARALLTRPELVLLDEPSMGLAPTIVQEIFEIISQLNRQKQMSFLIAEQNTNISLRHAHRAAVIDSGRVVLHGTADELLARGDLHQIYLGIK
ncbi:MAG TPA: ABC transporter ATP-binding protein [Dongiaceae bacterium]|nr:ABC transporter ATP-binding protein [Dongiaceae bacterium]